MRQHLIEPFALHRCCDDCREVLQCDLHRIIEAGNKHQEHEKCEQGDLAGCQQGPADDRSRCNAELENDRARIDADRELQFREQRLLFDVFDFLVEPLHIRILRIICTQITHGFKAFLNAVGELHFDGVILSGCYFLVFCRAPHRQKCCRNDPEACQCNPPIEKDKHTHTDECRRNQRTDKLRNPVARCGFNLCAIAHDGGGQVGDVFLFEIRQRQLSQTLCKCGSAHAAFFVSREKCCVVLDEICKRDQHQNEDGCDPIKRDPVRCQGVFQQVFDEQVEHGCRHHQDNVRHGDAHARLCHIHRTLVRQCEFVLQIRDDFHVMHLPSS